MQNWEKSAEQNDVYELLEVAAAARDENEIILDNQHIQHEY